LNVAGVAIDVMAVKQFMNAALDLDVRWALFLTKAANFIEDPILAVNVESNSRIPAS